LRQGMCSACHFPQHAQRDGETGLVGTSFGRFVSHRPVFLLASSPYIYGCMYWSALRILVLMQPTGFSMAILWIGAAMSWRTNSSASSVSCGSRRPRVVQCIPDEQRYVHGGCAIIMSQFEFEIYDRTSPCRCCPSAGSRSHDHASCPRSENASRTMPEDSHAIRIFILDSPRWLPIRGILLGRRGLP